MTDTFVYFIKPVGKPGPVKIGWSQSPVNRLMTMMAWSPFPLEIIVTIPGPYELEQNLHQCFADTHSHSEWFHPSPRLTAAISALRAGKDIAEAVDLNDRRGMLARKPKGGGSWSPTMRMYMSIYMRLLHAAKRAGKMNHDRRWCPVDVSAFADAVQHGHTPTAAELERLSEVLAHPEVHFLTHAERYSEQRAAA